MVRGYADLAGYLLTTWDGCDAGLSFCHSFPAVDEQDLFSFPVPQARACQQPTPNTQDLSPLAHRLARVTVILAGAFSQTTPCVLWLGSAQCRALCELFHDISRRFPPLRSPPRC